MASVELGIFKKSKCFRQLTNSLQVGFNMSDKPFEQREVFFMEVNSHILPKASSVFGLLMPEI
jgi:hypothetical protein